MSPNRRAPGAHTLALTLALWLSPTLVTLAPAVSAAVGTCGGQKDTCKCGKNNPYPCCDNGSNCTWWAWHEACCTWNIALPGWGNANTWHAYAKSNPDFVVQGSPSVGSIATSTKGKYGHVAWVIAVGNGNVTVREMNCCGTCKWGMGTRVHATSYFNSGFVRPKPKGPVCGNGKCEGGESCASCAKDCGGCCGNGKCDHGETCTTCTKDCVCLPKGGFDVAGSTALRGWAQDPNAPASAVTVEIQADGKKVAGAKANQAHSAVKGHGFSVVTPTQLCDNQAHTLTALAIDTAGKGKPSVGQRALRCRSDLVSTGPYATEHQRASALMAAAAQDTAAPERAGGGGAMAPIPLAGLRHDHPKGAPYATGGAIESCITPGVQPFDAVETVMTRAMGGLPFAAEVRVDSVVLATLKSDGAATVPAKTNGIPASGDGVKVFGGGLTLCLRTWATTEAVHSPAGHVALAAPQFRLGAWRYGLETPGHGLKLDLRAADRPALFGGPAATGAIRLWRGLDEPFDSVHGHVDQADSRAEVSLLPSANATIGVPLTGDFALARLPKHMTLALRWGRAGQTPPPSDAAAAGELLARIDHLRVARNDTRRLGLFDVAHMASFGLQVAAAPQAQLPAQPRDLGLQVAMSHKFAGWWSTGGLRVALELPGPAFDRVRLRLRGSLADPALALVASTEAGALAVQLPAAAANVGEQRLELALAGQRLRLDLLLSEDRWQAPSSGVELRSIALCRGGWWTLPSADARGLQDTRSASGGVRLEALEDAAAASSGGADAVSDARPPSGSWLVSRELTAPQTAVRFTLKQHLTVGALRLRLLLDDSPAAVLDAPGPSEQPVAVKGAPFTRIGLLLQVKPGAMNAKGFAEFADLEVRGVDGVWRPVAAIPIVLGEALVASRAVGVPGAVSASDAVPDARAVSTPPAAHTDRGCSIGRGNRHLGGGWSAALLLAALWLVGARRRRQSPA